MLALGLTTCRYLREQFLQGTPDMSMKEKFLKEAKIGESVEVAIGRKNIQGIVVSLDTSTVQIKKSDGKTSTLSLEAIDYFEFSGDDETLAQFPDAELASENTFQGASQVRMESRNASDNKPSVDHYLSNPIPPQEIFAILEENGVTFFKDDNKPCVTTYSDVAKAEKSSRLRSKLLAIANSLDFAMVQNHEAGPADYKIQENIKKLQKMKNENVASKTFANMLGALYYQLKCDRLALEAYEEGDDNESAFTIAENIKSTECMEKFACRHLVNSSVLNAHILKQLALLAIDKNDFSIISSLFISLMDDAKVPGVIAFIKALLVSRGEKGFLGFDNSKDSLRMLISVSMDGLMDERIGGNFKMVENIKDIDFSETENTKHSYFEAASEARDRRLYDLAEKFYLKAIDKEDNCVNSVIQILEMFIQIENDDKFTEYFKKYAMKYLASYPHRYKEFYTILANKNPKVVANLNEQERIKQKERINQKNNAKTTNSGWEIYTQKARDAQLNKKNLDEAIKYYKLAIEKGEKLSSNVLDLAMIYNQRSEFDAALELLDDYSKYIEKRKYLNSQIAIYLKAKDLKYKNAIIETFKQLRSLPGSVERELLIAEGGLMNRISEHQRAIKIFNDVLNGFDNDISENDEEKNKKILIVLNGLCLAHFMIRDHLKAKEYAEKILELNPEDTRAKAVISGHSPEYNLKIEDDEFWDFSSFISREVKDVEVSNFFIEKMDSINLMNEIVDKTTINEGKYIGSQYYASRIIESIKDKSTRNIINEESKSQLYFIIAKLIRQILDRKEKITEDIINEQQYQMSVAIGCFLWGSHALSNSSNYDTARYCFWQAIKIFQNFSDNTQCWAAATSRFVQTYFLPPKEIGEMKRESFYYNFENYRGDYNNKLETELNVSMSKEIQNSVDGFITGMMDMIQYNNKAKEEILNRIFNHHNSREFFESICKIGNIDNNEDNSFAEFERFWELSTTKYFEKRNSFLELIDRSIDSVFKVGELQDNYNKYVDNEFRELLNTTDKECIIQLDKILSKLINYNNESQFESKAEILSSIEDARTLLQSKISNSPTFFSFEKIIPELDKLRTKIYYESQHLYKNAKPEISVVLSSHCSIIKIDENTYKVTAPISFVNKNNVQKADNISIKIEIEGEGIEIDNSTNLGRTSLSGNGVSMDRLVCFKITADVYENKAFDVNFKLNYQYKSSLTEIIDEPKDYTLSIPLYSSESFVHIENIFDQFKNGAQVTNRKMFYGRDDDIENIIKQICDKNGDVLRGRSLALYGQTRTGKSSLLFHLKNRIREIDRRNNSEKNVIVDIGSLGTTGSSMQEFLFTLLDVLNNEIKGNHPLLKEILEEDEIEIVPAKILEENETVGQVYFNSIIRKITNCVERSNKKYSFIFMIDEFTYIYDWINRGVMTSNIMNFWKGFIQNYGFFAVVVGQDHMMEFVSDNRFTNAFGSIDLWKVTYLSEPYAKKLMYEPIMFIDEKGDRRNRFQDSALDMLYELTAGSAFLIMKLCAGLVDYLNEQKTIIVTRAHVEDYLRKNIGSIDEASYFHPQYDDKKGFTQEERNERIEKNKKMLQRIAQSSNRREWASIRDVVVDSDDSEIFDSLVARDVIVSQQGRCKIKVGLYKEFILFQ